MPSNQSYAPRRIAAGTANDIGKGRVTIGSIICETPGNVSIWDGLDNTGTVLLTAVAMVAGQVWQLNAEMSVGLTITTTGNILVTYDPI